MSSQAVIYMAVDAEDRIITDMILAHLKHTRYRCIDCTHVPDLLDPVTDLHGAMSDADVIIVIDSKAFRRQQPNYELQFAQSLEKPLIVISLDQAVNENRSTARVQLFDFTNPRHRDWTKVIETIINMTETATHIDDDFLF